MKFSFQFRTSGVVLAASLSLAASSLMFCATAANASSVLTCEDPATGCDITLPNGVRVASDGEQNFDPLGYGADTSDGIQFDPRLVVSSGNPDWIQLTNAPNTWVLPADLTSIGCGAENGTTCEPVGQWFIPGVHFLNETFVLLEGANGPISDVITFNDNVDSGTSVTFVSDPVPEPAVWATMLIGFFGVGFMMRRVRNAPTFAIA